MQGTEVPIIDFLKKKKEVQKKIQPDPMKLFSKGTKTIMHPRKDVESSRSQSPQSETEPSNINSITK